MDHVNGIDVSDWQGAVDWSIVKSDGYSFGYAKATQSTSWTSGTFAANMTGMRAAKVLAGAYHMFDFTTDPKAQAQHFLGTYAPTAGDLPPMLDLELATPGGPRDAIARIAQFLTVVEKACGGTLMVVYMNGSFWQDNLGGTDAFSGHPLWLANYTSGPNPTFMPSAWKTPTFWQYSQAGTLAGVEGNIDLDRFLGTLPALRQMTLK